MPAHVAPEHAGTVMQRHTGTLVDENFPQPV
jgi:hypothetical protein